MKDRLIFIGGIHGAGKTQFANLLAKRYETQHVIASDLIRTLKNLPTHKRVEDVEKHQDLLVLALKNLDRTSNIVLLDGHYCLITATGQVEEVPLHTFRQLAPMALIVVSNSIDVIRQRLEERDGSTFSVSFLHNFQNSEIERAERVSAELGIRLEHIVTPRRIDIEKPRLAALFRG